MSDLDDGGSGGLISPPRSPTGTIRSPYVPGAIFTAHRHQPPAPFGGYYSRCEPPSQDQLERTSQLDWCMSHPPSAGTTDFDEVCSLEIESEIRTGSDCGAQVVCLKNGTVAKIYDPLFYSFQDRDFLDLKVDVATAADSDYTVEAAAYSELREHPVEGTIAPIYHGSWSIKVTHEVGGEHVMRDVRLILIEHIPGVSMLDLDPDDLTSEVKEEIMIRVIEANYDLRDAGVHHEDLSPRNIMISFSPASFVVSRLTLIDFGHSTVAKICYGGPPRDEFRNPLFEWSSASVWSSYGWLPPCTEETISRMWEIFGDGRGGKYVKVERNPNSLLGKPLRPGWDFNF